MNTHQKVDVISFAAEFHKAAIPFFQNPTERSFEEIHDFRNDDFATVFRDKDYMHPNKID
jgi:hypothetical protein